VCYWLLVIFVLLLVIGCYVFASYCWLLVASYCFQIVWYFVAATLFMIVMQYSRYEDEGYCCYSNILLIVTYIMMLLLMKIGC